MEDSTDLPLLNENPCSSLRCICVNEILIRNHSYIISMSINHSEEPQIDIKVEAKQNGDQWRSTFDVTTIEKMTAKTGNFKSFNVFVTMLEDAINQKSSSVSIDLFTCDDLDSIRQNQQNHREHSSSKSSTKRYLILIYNAEYDRIYYPLSLRYCGRSDPAILIDQIRQLSTENHVLKSQFESDTQRLDFQQECFRLKKENDDYRQQLLLNNAKEKDQQIEYLRQMIRRSEDALTKENNQLKKSKIKKDDRYKILINQIESLKISERQLKLQVKSLTNQMDFINKNGSSYKSHQRSSSLSRPTSSTQRRHRSSSVIKRFPSSIDSHIRFNPTAYIHERNLKLRQIELQKKKETRRRLSSARCHSDSDISDTSVRSNDHHRRTASAKKNPRRKRTNNLCRHKSNDSIDSDIERVSSPPVLHKAASNNSTILYSPEHSHDDQPNTNPNNVIDIDQRLKSLEKFIRQNFPR